jgi:hypothetical protein
MEGHERRRHERLVVTFPLPVRDGDRRVGTVVDISRGGLRVRLDDEIRIKEDDAVREWTGEEGETNRDLALQRLVGEEHALDFIYLSTTLGRFRARVVRVVRAGDRAALAMEFTEIAPALLDRVLGIVRRRPAT